MQIKGSNPASRCGIAPSPMIVSLAVV